MVTCGTIYIALHVFCIYSSNNIPTLQHNIAHIPFVIRCFGKHSAGVLHTLRCADSSFRIIEMPFKQHVPIQENVYINLYKCLGDVDLCLPPLYGNMPSTTNYLI